MELWLAFMLGLAGSAHCAGMCGPLALALPRRSHGTRPRAEPAGLQCWPRHDLLPAGRGVWIDWSESRARGVQRWVSIGLGVAILIGLLVAKTRALTMQFALPVAWLKSALGRLIRQQTLASQYLFGVLNGLLPCGLVYIACVGAAATGRAGLRRAIHAGLRPRHRADDAGVESGWADVVCELPPAPAKADARLPRCSGRPSDPAWPGAWDSLSQPGPDGRSTGRVLPLNCS